VSAGRYPGKKCKLTKFTADAIVVTTQFNIAAATELLRDHTSAMFFQLFLQDPLEKLFG